MDYKRPTIVFWILIVSAFFAEASVVDSIGIRNDENGIFILHQVDAKETLYALSRRYGTSVASIIDHNQITGNSLSVGSILRIPWSHGLVHIVKADETLYSISRNYQVPVQQVQNLNNLNSNKLEIGMPLIMAKKSEPLSAYSSTGPVNWHIVGDKETLYSISKAHNVDLNHLKSWNHLISTNVRAGDTLLLSGSKQPPSIQTYQVYQPDTISAIIAVASSTQSESPTEQHKQLKSNDVAPVKENGIAAVIDGDSDTKKYLALHGTAPVGTIMRVRNEMTNLSVFVRVLV